MTWKRLGAAAIAIATGAALWFGLHRPRGADHGGEATRPACCWIHASVPAVTGRAASPPGSGSRAGDAEGRFLIEGQVVGPDGAGVGGASVFLTTSTPRAVVSESDGSFAFDRVGPRSYAITATAGDLIGGPVVVQPRADTDPVVVRLAPGAALAVRVTDERGQPVAAARIALDDPTARVATTDESGVVVLRPIHVGPVAASVSAPRYATARAVTSVASAEPISELAIMLHEGFSVSGRVVDDRGNPIAGAELRVAGGAASAADRIESDSAGRFTVPGLAAGVHRLLASDGEHAPAESALVTITDHAVSDIEIAMPPGGVIAGAVLAADGAPAREAVVRLVSRGVAAATTFVREMACDERGQFEIRGVPRARVQVQAEADAASSDGIEVDLTGAPAARGLELVVDGGGVISGVVVDPTGQPVPEIQVTARGEGVEVAGQGVSRLATTTTDGSGAFSLRGLRAGAYRLHATGAFAALRNPEGGTPAVSGASGVRIALVAAGGLRGNLRVSGGGAPERAFVQLADRPVRPVTGGRFEITDATPGVYDVTWRGPGFADLVKRGVVVEGGKVTDLGTIDVTRGRTLRGRVIDEHGAPVAGAQLQVGQTWRSASEPAAVADDAMSGVRSATSDGNGGFTITGLPATATTLSARHAVRGRSRELGIQAGDRDPPTAILVVRGGGSVAGTLTMQARPQGGATVTIAPQDGAEPPLVTRTADDGTFSFPEVPEGLHVVSAVQSTSATARLSASATVRVTGGERSTVALDLPRGAIRLSVEIRGVSGRPVDDIAVLLFQGGVAATTEAELSQAARHGSLQGMAASRGDAAPPPAFDQLVPGRYSVCTAPSRGDTQAASSGRVSCNQLDVLPSPAHQSVVLDLTSTAPAAPHE